LGGAQRHARPPGNGQHVMPVRVPDAVERAFLPQIMGLIRLSSRRMPMKGQPISGPQHDRKSAFGASSATSAQRPALLSLSATRRSVRPARMRRNLGLRGFRRIPDRASLRNGPPSAAYPFPSRRNTDNGTRDLAIRPPGQRTTTQYCPFPRLPMAPKCPVP
jgi:hypothetical protein